MTIPEARKKIIDALNDKELVLDQKTVQQNVSVGERSETPVEFVMVPQWFINVLDHRDAFLKRSEELEWFPDWMKVRLDHWIEGLKYNWNISRQRFYGVPFPVWYVEETGEIAVAKEEDLPIDPMEDSPPPWMLEHYKGKTLVPESDVMDTWMTSSLTPLINANWAERDNIKGAMQNIYPMDLRIQAFEIIRTWLFYTVIKSHFHTDSLPWKTVMISGWGLNEQGKKISKRHLESFTDQNGFNRYEPYSLIEKYGADAVRYWAANGQLGQNLRFHEREVKDGRKIVVKLWNVARMVFMYLDDFDPAKDYVSYDERTLEDRWISFELDKVVSKTTDYLDKYDYSGAKETIHKFFWMTYCDTYLELVKTRFWDEYSWTEQDKRSAQSALLDSLNILLKILAPFLPFITEEIYQKAGKFGEDYASLHVAEWPKAQNLAFEDDGRMKILLDILYKARKSRSEQSISQSNQLDKVTICIKESNVDISKDGYMNNAVLSAVRAKKVEWQTLSKDMEENNILVQLA